MGLAVEVSPIVSIETTLVLGNLVPIHLLITKRRELRKRNQVTDAVRGQENKGDQVVGRMESQ